MSSGRNSSDMKNTRHLFIEGEIFIGKTALLNSVLSCHMKSIGGFTVERREKQGLCTGYLLSSVQESFLPKSKQIPEKKRLFMERDGVNWVYHPEVFDQWAAALLDREINEKYRLYLLDEIGGIEVQSDAFVNRLITLLKKRNCIGVYKQQKNSEAQAEAMNVGKGFQKKRRLLIDEIMKHEGRIITLTENNKNSIAEEVNGFLADINMGRCSPKELLRSGVCTKKKFWNTQIKPI